MAVILSRGDELNDDNCSSVVNLGTKFGDFLKSNLNVYTSRKRFQLLAHIC